MDDQGGARATAPGVVRSASLAAPAAPLAEASSSPAALQRSELSRLFIVCGRDRKAEELRALFSTCGPIKHLHLALDRSKKSRGFAFLQYEDPANAAAAIERLDHMKLEDGHILKVTVAKERPAGGSGKLKRNQHARQDLDGKTDGEMREEDGSIDARLPGKRQRSSPPVAALPLPLRVTPSFLLESHQFGAKMTNLKTNTLPETLSMMTKDERVESVTDEKQVEQVIRALVLAVEENEKDTGDLFAIYARVMTNPKRSGLLPPPRSKHHLRRRRQSLDGSGSSGEDGAEGSGVRRKRSNTTTSPPPTMKTQPRQPLSPPRKFSDRSDISLSPEALKAEFTAQELEAMFAVYGDFEAVELVKSFGRPSSLKHSERNRLKEMKIQNDPSS
eukprot:jgi/Phyca11/16445/fgenesh1_pg.PHYCAscaffold_20_\